MTEAMAVILAAEIGDKSFFVAIILAMKYDKWLVLFSSMIALSLMSISSAIFGGLISQIDHNLLQWGAAVTYREDALVTPALFILPPPPPPHAPPHYPHPQRPSLSLPLCAHPVKSEPPPPWGNSLATSSSSAISSLPRARTCTTEHALMAFDHLPRSRVWWDDALGRVPDGRGRGQYG